MGSKTRGISTSVALPCLAGWTFQKLFGNRNFQFSVLGNMKIRYITALLLLSLVCLSSSRPQFLERFLSILGGGRRQDGRLRYNLVQEHSPMVQREFRARYGEQMEGESLPSASATKNTCICRCDCCPCCPCAEELQYIDT